MPNTRTQRNRHKLNEIAQHSAANRLLLGSSAGTHGSKRKRFGTPGAFGGKNNRRGGLRIVTGYVPGDGHHLSSPVPTKYGVRSRDGITRYVRYSDGSLRH